VQAPYGSVCLGSHWMRISTMGALIDHALLKPDALAIFVTE